MRNHLLRISISVAVIIMLMQAWAAAQVKMTVLNPRGEITLPPVTPLSARLSEFAGKKIGLYWNEKAGGNHFWNQVEQQLKAKLPGATVLRYQGAFDLKDELAQKLARETDAFLYGVGD
jgi:hypothetical protein